MSEEKHNPQFPNEPKNTTERLQIIVRTPFSPLQPPEKKTAIEIGQSLKRLYSGKANKSEIMFLGEVFPD